MTKSSRVVACAVMHYHGGPRTGNASLYLGIRKLTSLRLDLSS